MPVSRQREELVKQASELNALLCEIIMKLDKHHKNCNIAKAVMNGVSTFGGVAALSGVIMSFTISGPVGPIAIACACFSTVTSSGSAITTVVEYFLKENNYKEAEKKWGLFKQTFEACCSLDLNNEIGGRELAINGYRTVLSSVNGVAIATVRAANAAKGLGVTLAKSFAGINALFLPFSIYEFINEGVELAKQTGSPASRPLRNLQQFLQNIIDGRIELTSTH